MASTGVTGVSSGVARHQQVSSSGANIYHQVLSGCQQVSPLIGVAGVSSGVTVAGFQKVSSTVINGCELSPNDLLALTETDPDSLWTVTGVPDTGQP